MSDTSRSTKPPVSAEQLAFVVVNDAAAGCTFAEKLSNLGLKPGIFTDPREALNRCRRTPPALVIVEDNVGGMRGVDFLSALLRISWTTSTILITDQDEEIVHEKTEGLGILGRVTDFGDREGLAKLLKRFLDANLPPGN
ncbi:MAG: hypothetical protein LDL33_13630 [Desulfomonile sp.]|nr:hypothetical protein [Desulfomonile sp.]